MTFRTVSNEKMPGHDVRASYIAQSIPSPFELKPAKSQERDANI